MKRHNLMSLLFFLVVSGVSCAQTKHGIRTIHAFSREQMPGNIPMPGLGLPAGPDTVYTIYVETSDKKIQWDSAWSYNRTYTVEAVVLTEKRAEPGINKNNGEKIVLIGDKKRYLYVLYLLPVMQFQPAPAPVNQGRLLLKGRHDEKSFLQSISHLVELKAFPSV